MAKHVLVCARAKDKHEHVKGSIPGGNCTECGEAVVVTRSGVEWRKVHPGAPTICSPCAARNVLEGHAIAEAAPGAIDELIEDLLDRKKKAGIN